MQHGSNAAVDARYWSGLAAGRLEMPRCVQCQQWHWPPVFRCGECGCWEQVWHTVEPIGSVFSYVRSHHRFAGTEGLELPYITVLVALPHAGDRRLLGLLVGDDKGLKIGVTVRGETAFTEAGGRRIPVMQWHLSESAK